MQRLELAGQRFERLTVIDRGPNHEAPTMSFTTWNCLCDCGNRLNVTTNKLRSGSTKSCGCYGRDQTSVRNFKHGLRHSRLMRIWSGMTMRCGNPNLPHYKDYGGRGIKNEFEDFETFYHWALSNGYQDNLSIDRIDNDGNYRPDNCRWATALQQARNTRHCVVNEETVSQVRSLNHLPRKVVAAMFGLKESTIKNLRTESTWKDVH